MSEQTTPRTVEEVAQEEAERVFGWQHLVRYSGMSVEWMDRTLGAIVRNALRAQAARMPSVTRHRVWVHREADGYLLSISSLPPDRRDVDADDIVTEQYVWIENPDA